jgi:hypothetical protein
MPLNPTFFLSLRSEVGSQSFAVDPKVTSQTSQTSCSQNQHTLDASDQPLHV